MANCEILRGKGNVDRAQVWPEIGGDTSHVAEWMEIHMNVDVGRYGSRELKEFLFYGFSFLCKFGSTVTC